MLCAGTTGGEASAFAVEGMLVTAWGGREGWQRRGAHAHANDALEAALGDLGVVREREEKVRRETEKDCEIRESLAIMRRRLRTTQRRWMQPSDSKMSRIAMSW